MATFMDVHHGMTGITAEQLAAAHRADLAIQAGEHVHFKQAWADPETGTVYCLSDAPSKEAVQRVHERAGHRADEIHHVSITI
ncbi:MULTISPECIES: SCO4226 family nickel-binding protein [Kitasatospora]|uniref:SCO4226 family nickel-binding protein n=1 Tax=Kitasatospora cystarginea TaxID=58350 RepID=A0ABN3DFK5_9ACTN